MERIYSYELRVAYLVKQDACILCNSKFQYRLYCGMGVFSVTSYTSSIHIFTYFY